MTILKLDRVASVAFSLGLALAGQGQALAQETGADGIQEIVVTAEKRESTVQKSAVAITVFDAKALRDNGVQALQDITKLSPGVSLGQNSANTIVTVRGVSSRDTNEIGDPAVSISTDGFYIQRPTGLSNSVYDLERVEVLRGPQGTLYGRNATGGAINFITAKPKDEFEARASVGIGNYDLITTEGMLNVPISPTLSARASFQTTQRDGYRTNEAPARAGDDADASSGRLHLLWKPTDRLSVLLTGQLTKLRGVGPTLTGYPIVGASNINYVPDLSQGGVPHGLPNQYIDTTTRQVQLGIDYEFDFATLIYQGGYRNMKYTQLRDLDGVIGSGNYFNPSENPIDWSHELRLVSNGDGPFKWQFGGYYFEEKNTLLTYYRSYAASSAGQNLFVFSYDVVARAKALFGQASYEVLPGLTGEFGIRYSNDHKTRTGFQNLGAANVPQNGDVKSSEFTYHVGVNYQVTPANLLYAKFDTGYKAGGFTDVLGVGIFSYDPESIKAIEFGSKNRFLNNSLQLNLSGFWYDYRDQQAAVAQTTGTGAGTTYVVNAGKSRIYGGEVEVIAQPWPGGQFDGSLAYLYSKYTDLCLARAASGICTRDLAGNRAVQAPRWQLSGGYQHSFDFLGGTLVPRAQTHFESASYLGVENYIRQQQKSYWRTDATLTYTSEDKRWELQGYIRNLSNTIVITAATASFGAYNYGLDAPRTYGAKLTVNF